MGPIIAGVIISMNEGLRGYTIVFTMAFVMFLFTTMGSLRLASQGSHHKSYYLGLIPLLIRKNKSFRHGLYGWFILGAYQGLLILLPNILLFHVLQKENLVGYTSGALLVLTMIAGFYMTRFGKSELARLYILIASFGFVVGAFVMLRFGLHLWTVIFFTVTFYGCIPLLVNSFTAYYYYLIGTLPLKGNLRVETVVVREMFLNTGRFVGILGLITVSSDLYSPWIGAVLFVTAMLQFNFLWIIKPRQPHNTP
jgi:YQGE family putative transporter